MNYKFKEAYAHISYQRKTDPSDVISVWNSRDGEVPLVLSKKGVEYKQITIEYKPDPEYQLKPGDFAFRSLKGYEIDALVKKQMKVAMKKMTKKPTRIGKTKYKKQLKKRLQGNAVLIKIGEE